MVDIPNAYISISGIQNDRQFRLVFVYFDRQGKSDIPALSYYAEKVDTDPARQCFFYELGKENDFNGQRSGISWNDISDQLLPKVSLADVDTPRRQEGDYPDVDWEYVLPRKGTTVYAIPHMTWNLEQSASPQADYELVNGLSYRKLELLWDRKAGSFSKGMVTGSGVVPAASVEPKSMVTVGGGTFTMGSPKSEQGRDADEVPHQVTVSSFHIGKFDVTQGLYQSVMGRNPSKFTGDPNRPVEQVSWYDAVEFCNKLSQRDGLQKVYMIKGTNVSVDWSANGYRLPTEAEWEYAARGGQQGTAEYHAYAGADDPGQVAWYAGHSGSTTHPVGQKSPNALGLYDMSGNVWQWCWDWFGDYSAGAQNDPRGAPAGSSRILRGGSFDYGARDDRVAMHYGTDPAGRYASVGFRLVRQ